MVAVKKSPIHADLFPNAEHVEKADEKKPARRPSVDSGFAPSQGGQTRPGSPTAADTPDDADEAQNLTPEMREKITKDKLILVYFEEGDPENPMNWSKGRKWVITFLLCMMTCIIGLSTSAYSNTIDGMTQEFGVANVVGQVGMFTFNAACAVAPLILAPICEQVGRRQVYLSAFACFTLCFLFLALAKNVETEIIGRFFSGLFGCCGTILVGGTLADIWDTHERSIPMSCFTFVAIFGTIAAPLYCGYIDQYAGWRWIEWTHMIASGTLFVAEVFFLKETRGQKILTDRARALRKETNDERYRAAAELENENIKELLKKSSTRAIMLLIKEPVLLFFGLWIAFAWGVTFLFLSVIPLTYSGNHGWSEGNSGLPYIALILGCFVGFASGLWGDRKYDKVREENDGVPVPEYRLYSSLVFAACLPIGLYIFSFTQYGFVHWMGPTVALVLIITGIYSIFLAVYNYTTDAYGELASSAIAGQGFLRNMFGATTPLFGNQMFRGMGYQYAGLLLALLSTVMAPLPYVLFKWGAGIRAKSKYAAANTSAEKVKGAAAGGTASDEEAQNKTQHQRQQNVIQAV